VPQNVLQDAPIPEVIEFIERINSANQGHPLQTPVSSHDLRNHPLTWFDFAM
jgi:hypothetical protein